MKKRSLFRRFFCLHRHKTIGTFTIHSKESSTDPMVIIVYQLVISVRQCEKCGKYTIDIHKGIPR